MSSSRRKDRITFGTGVKVNGYQKVKMFASGSNAPLADEINRWMDAEENRENEVHSIEVISNNAGILAIVYYYVP